MDDIEGLSVTNKAILIHGTGKQETDSTVSAPHLAWRQGNLHRWNIHPRFTSISLLGNCSSPTSEVRGGHSATQAIPRSRLGLLPRPAFRPRLDDGASFSDTGATIRPNMATNCLPVSAHQFDAAVERSAL